MIPAASPRPPIKPTCRCPALVRSYFPDCTEDSIGDFLLAATPYPCGDCDDVEQALCEHRAAGCRTAQAAVDRADTLTREAGG